MIFLIKYWRELAIALLIIFSLLSVRQCQENKSDLSLAIQSRDSAYLVADHWINKHGESVNTINTWVATVDQLRNENLNLNFDIERLEEEVGNLKNLVAHYKGKASKRDTIRVPVIDTVLIEKGDSVKGRWFAYSNQWLKLDGIATETQVRIAYNYQVDFTITAFRKRQGLFKPKQLVTNITFSDPNLIVGQFQGVVIKEPPKQWYERKIVWGLTGFVLGAIITKQ